MELYKRIRQRREELGLTQDELAKRMGYKSRSSINKIEMGENDIPQSKIVQFAKALETTPGDLMGWDTEKSAPQTTEKNPNTFDIFSIPNILPVPEMVAKPLIGTIACGTPILAVENVEDRVMVPKDIRCDFVLRCKGDSMINAMIMDGSLVYVREQPDVENGEIAAVVIEDESDCHVATLKRVYKTATSITLMPENNRYAPSVFMLDEMNRVRILGVVVAWTNFLK